MRFSGPAELQKLVKDRLLSALGDELEGSELLFKEVYEACESEMELAVVRAAIERLMVTITNNGPAVIETRKHVVARLQPRHECDATEMWFEDGTAVWVSTIQMNRACEASGFGRRAVMLVGATATLENVEGRWVLARLELAK